MIELFFIKKTNFVKIELLNSVHAHNIHKYSLGFHVITQIILLSIYRVLPEMI
jgi:hypothetical protein